MRAQCGLRTLEILIVFPCTFAIAATAATFATFALAGIDEHVKVMQDGIWT
jgi:hypothetical protein